MHHTPIMFKDQQILQDANRKNFFLINLGINSQPGNFNHKLGTGNGTTRCDHLLTPYYV